MFFTRMFSGHWRGLVTSLGVVYVFCLISIVAPPTIEPKGQVEISKHTHRVATPFWKIRFLGDNHQIVLMPGLILWSVQLLTNCSNPITQELTQLSIKNSPPTWDR